jgi:hypothetical protein
MALTQLHALGKTVLHVSSFPGAATSLSHMQKGAASSLKDCRCFLLATKATLLLLPLTHAASSLSRMLVPLSPLLLALSHGLLALFMPNLLHCPQGTSNLL